MFNIPKVEKESYYIDKAMEQMQEFAIKTRENIDERFSKSSKTKEKTFDKVKLDKRKDLELEKIRHLNERLHISLKKLIKQFPKFTKVDEIYLKLINTSEINVATIEDSLRRINWISNTIDEFTQNTEVKIKRAKTQKTVGFLMKKYLGKVNSLFRKNKSFFANLENARKFMNKLPTFLDIFTVSIAGFPNVGKSTLMKKITNSDVEIQNYPFTTKGLMFGYLKQGNDKTIQFIDTPGLLNRDKVSNNIEKRAQVVLSDYSDIIIFVIDFTQSCGYDIQSQIKLLKKTEEKTKKLVIYLSKTDIFDKEDFEIEREFKIKLKKYIVFRDYIDLTKYLLEEKSKNKKFNIKDINVIK